MRVKNSNSEREISTEIPASLSEQNGDARERPTKRGSLPSELPEGCTRKMGLHLNYGSAGGGAIFTVHLPSGKELPITYQYDTRKPTPAVEAQGERKAKPAFEPAPTGFNIRDEKGEDDDIVVHPTWRSCREAWKRLRAVTESL